MAMRIEESPPSGIGVYILKCIKWLNVFGKLTSTSSVHDIPTCKANAKQALNPHARQEMEMLCNFNTFFFNLNTRPQMLHVTVQTKLTV